MTQQVRQLKITHEEITAIFSSLLKIPKGHRTLHPCHERSRYSDILDWLTKTIAELLKVKDLTPRQLCERQQQIIVSCFEELKELAKKECVQKSILLQMILEYLVGTLNAYWKALENANRQVWYEFEHNSVRVERQYINELKRIQAENEELKKDKEHRWRNMFMLIKDNRIHRRQNRKLLVAISYEMEKNVALAEQMILLREENEKLKLKLAYFENDPIRLESYVETHLKLLELDKSIRNYPKRSKKILKNDLLKIQIQQINNLNDRVKFIIKAIEETGEIIDQFYDEETIWSNFQYNISTQTEMSTDEKGTNTPVTRTISTETALHPADLNKFQVQETYNLIIRGLKRDQKDTKQREMKPSMLMPNSFNSSNRFSSRRQDDKIREISYRRMMDTQFSICQSVKMTIYNGRISYISTYNTEIFNGPEMIKRLEEKMQTQKKDPFVIKQQVEVTEMEVQTEPEEASKFTRSQFKQTTKFASTLPLFFNSQSQEFCEAKKKKTLFNNNKFNISQEINFEYNPTKSKSQHPKFKLAIVQPNILQPAQADKGLQSNRNLLRTPKRMNSIQKFYNSNLEDSILIKKLEKEQEKKLIAHDDFSTQTQEKANTQRFKDFQTSITNLDSKQDRLSLTKQSTSNNASLLGSVDIKKLRNEAMKKPFNQSADNIIMSKMKPKAQRSSEISLIKNVEPKKIAKISKSELLKHKRTATEINESQTISETSVKLNRQFKMKPLHRISQVLTEGDLIKEEANPKDKNSLPLMLTKEGEIRAMDFSKGVEKILKNMDVRRNQIIANNYSLKTYLSSYFKCLYGRQIYNNFIQFLARSQPQEAVICFSRLSNSKSPEPYLVDLFKAFVKSIGKCYLLGQSPCSPRLRQQVLKYLSSLFLEQQQMNSFAVRMRNKGCYSLMGWFNSLQLQLRMNAIQSQLYTLLSNWFNESCDSLSYDFIQEIAYFMQNDNENYKFLIKSKFFLSDNVPIHRFCLFCYRYQWDRMLKLQLSIEEEYYKRLGKFNEEDSLRRIEQNSTILSEFKYLEKCFKYWCFLNQKYNTPIHPQLIMIIELNILEYRLKNETPISKDLKYLNLIFEGLQKKKEFQNLKAKLENGQTKDNYLDSKAL